MGGWWLEKWGVKLLQLPTKLKLRLKLSLAIKSLKNWGRGSKGLVISPEKKNMLIALELPEYRSNIFHFLVGVGKTLLCFDHGLKLDSNLQSR